MKKRWVTPELVILFRGRPEESVLCHCKYAGTAPVAPYNSYNDCTSGSYCGCTACQNNTTAS
jgi:hypothetical protein